ncbi:MAG: hypothetical protein WBA46_14440 [Thermomicrobiales bacterium]
MNWSRRLLILLDRLPFFSLEQYDDDERVIEESRENAERLERENRQRRQLPIQDRVTGTWRSWEGGQRAQ